MPSRNVPIMWSLLRHCTRYRTPVRFYSSKAPSAEEVFKRKILQLEREKAQKAPEWEKREQSLRKRYGQWNPTHKLSRQQMNDVRELKQRAPHIKTVQISDFFNVNPESIRRILKSKWVPKEAELESIEKRAEKRKAASVERRLGEAKASGESRKADKVRVVSLTHLRSRNMQSHRHKDSRRRRIPYTEGVGDLIE